MCYEYIDNFYVIFYWTLSSILLSKKSGNIGIYDDASYFIKFYRLLNGLSKATPLIKFFIFLVFPYLAKNNIAVTAPILLPHKNIYLIENTLVIYSITEYKSSFSLYPKVVY